MASQVQDNQRYKQHAIPNEHPQKISILSLNCWGLKYISKYRHQRLKEIGAQLAIASPTPDIVGLQECWTQLDYQNIRQQTAHILPYGKFYHGGIFGAGLAILSRWPIEDSSMFQYPLNGRPTAFWRGDWYVGKGVACARIRLGPATHDILEVFNTHLHAPYAGPNSSSAYKEHRTAQAWEITKLIRQATEAGHLVLALGDFNIVPSSIAYKIITTRGQVKDIWRELHPDSAIAAGQNRKEQQRQRRQNARAATDSHRNSTKLLSTEPSQDAFPKVSQAHLNLSKNGTTCDSALNTWRWDKTLRKDLHSGRSINEQTYINSHADLRAKRLDYIFLGVPRASFASHSRTWKIEDAHVGMTMRHPTLRCSLSDHFSVEATISLTNRAATESTDEQRDALSLKTYDQIHKYILSSLARAKTQRRWRLAHFLGALIVSIGCLVGVWWSPHNFVAFVLMLVSSLGLVAGTVDGLIGGLFFSQEIRALKEWEWEVLNARERTAGGSEAGGIGARYEDDLDEEEELL